MEIITSLHLRLIFEIVKHWKSKQDNLDLQERIKLKEIKLREAELIETAKRNAIENKKVDKISKSTK